MLTIERSVDRIQYLSDGVLHREDGPAIEWANGSKTWYINGLRHREDGPAVEYANGTKFWYINGVAYSEEEFLMIQFMKGVKVNV